MRIFIREKVSVRQKDPHPSLNPPKVLCLKVFWNVRDVSNPSLVPHISLTQLSHSALLSRICMQKRLCGADMSDMGVLCEWYVRGM